MRKKIEFSGLYMTADISEHYKALELFEYLHRHEYLDFGTLCRSDKRTNIKALETGAMIMSEYVMHDGEKIWIISDAVEFPEQPRRTTILFPHEY